MKHSKETLVKTNPYNNASDHAIKKGLSRNSDLAIFYLALQIQRFLIAH